MKRWVSNTLIAIFAVIFLVSGYLLLDYFLDSGKQKAAFNDLASLMEQATIPGEMPEKPQQNTPVDTDAPTAPTEPLLVSVQDPETGEMVEVLPEFAELYVMNNDIVGWISIDDTNVNYPVMQTPDSTDYYLYKGFDKEYSRHGCIYVREECDVFAPSDNLTIYGHRMGDGTMFNDLHRYEKKSFWEEHRYITFNTLTEHHTYEIMFVFRIESSFDSPFLYHLFVDAADQDHFDSYIENCRSYALYDTGVDAQYGDKLITLSTCEYTRVNGRFVVVAKRISEEP
ncbi:MAG: class B sortase [Oscillospiraceae bacterium]|nr:class B sortase [Oscillospiraceae bacterium]